MDTVKSNLLWPFVFVPRIPSRKADVLRVIFSLRIPMNRKENVMDLLARALAVDTRRSTEHLGTSNVVCMCKHK